MWIGASRPSVSSRVAAVDVHLLGATATGRVGRSGHVVVLAVSRLSYRTCCALEPLSQSNKSLRRLLVAAPWRM
jgi:hypothetical protein